MLKLELGVQNMNFRRTQFKPKQIGYTAIIGADYSDNE